MNQYPFDRNLYNEHEALDYYIAAIEYRNKHKDQSVEIALHVFRRTNPKGMLSFTASEELERLRFEFAALEAPGWSEDETKNREESEDEAWDYLLSLVEKAKKQNSMSFSELNALLPIATREDLIGFWLAAIKYRKAHQASDHDLAHYVFVATLEVGRREPWYDDELDQLCSEFGALEAPGWPPGWPDDQSVDPEDYIDSLWDRLEGLIKRFTTSAWSSSF